MKTHKTEWGRWLVVVIFAIAMAWVESAVVFYLRTYIDRIVPYQANPLPKVGDFGPVELMREFATLVMLFTVGVLAGRNWRARFGYAFLAFGVWDIFYYVFLKVMCDWPQTLFDWDILFLIPLPWWGPVLAPMLIAMLMIVWGTLASQFETSIPVNISIIGAWTLSFLGCLMALRIFMNDAIRVSAGGVEAVRNVLPVRFDWTMFGVALAMMSAPLLLRLWNRVPKRKVPLATPEKQVESMPDFV